MLRYVKGTASYGLHYRRSEKGNDHLVGYCDSDYYGDLNRRRSLTGYCFTLFGNVVSWRAPLQSAVALLTTEAEFMALTDVTKEALWLQGLVKELGMKQDTFPVNSDSQSAIHLTKNQGYHKRKKHIDVRLHFIREVVASKTVKID